MKWDDVTGGTDWISFDVLSKAADKAAVLSLLKLWAKHSLLCRYKGTEVILILCLRVSITAIESLKDCFCLIDSYLNRWISVSQDEKPDFSCWFLNWSQFTLWSVVETLVYWKVSFETWQYGWPAWKACCKALWLNSDLIGHNELMVPNRTYCNVWHLYCRVFEIETGCWISRTDQIH